MIDAMDNKKLLCDFYLQFKDTPRLLACRRDNGQRAMVKAQYRRVFQSTTTGASACSSRLTFRRRNPGWVLITSTTKPSALKLII